MEHEEKRKFKKRLFTFGAVFAILLFVILLIAQLDKVNAWLGSVLRLLRPILIGLITAYLCNPFFRFFERKVLFKLRPHPLRRALSLILTYLTVLLIIALVFLLIIPQLIESIVDFTAKQDAYIASAFQQINKIIGAVNGFMDKITGNPQFLPPVEEVTFWRKFNEALSGFGSFLLDSLKSFNLKPITQILGNAFSVLTDTLFGLFISIYLLSTKEKRYAQIMKLRRALFGDNLNAHITKICTIADRSFGDFLEGKIIDSLIIGILTYLVLLTVQIPYAILLATFIGITNIVPIIGPIIGAIPTAIILLLSAPDKVIPFLIIVVIIQQLDGNVIGPKILGNNTGVSSLCVVISIAVMGALWGLVGMLLGVPLFATALELADELIVTRLQKKGLPSGLENYYATDIMVDPTQNASNSTDKTAQRFERAVMRIRRRMEEGETPTRRERFLLSLDAISDKFHILNELSDEAQVRFSAEDAMHAAEQETEAQLKALHIPEEIAQSFDGKED